MRTSNERRRNGSRTARLATLVTLAVGFTLPTIGRAAAVDGPAVTVTPASNVNLYNASITISGTGFNPTARGAQGIYVLLGPVQASPAFFQNADPYQAAKWVHTNPTLADPFQAPMNPDGSFSITLTGINARYTYVDSSDSSTKSVDCTVTQCRVLTVAAHGSGVRDQDTFTNLTFASPAVTVSPSTNLHQDGSDVVTVSGTNFEPTKNLGRGFYLAFGPHHPDYWTNPAYYEAVKWVHPGATPNPFEETLQPDGSFSFTLTGLHAQYTDGAATPVDCTVTSCEILTFGAQGGSDRSLDTFTPVSFAATPTVLPCSGVCASIGDGTSYEGGVLSLPITLSSVAGAPVSVTATIANGSATNGQGLPRTAAYDFKAKVARVVTIKAGALTGYLNVPIVRDTLTEDPETLSVTLSAPANAAIARATATGTILDANGITNEVLIGGASIVEPGAGGKGSVVKIPIVLSNVSGQTVTVQYQTQDAGATAGSDYKAKVPKSPAKPLLVTFKPNQTKKTVTVLINGDTDNDELTETVNVVFSSPVNAALGHGAVAHIDIYDKS